MFVIKNVTKKYGEEFALKDVSLDMGKGMNFIVGASGSGKTTLLKILSGMEQEFLGEVFYKDKAVKHLTEEEKSYLYNNSFGFVWQDFNLIEELTVLENIRIPQALKGNKDKNKLLKILKVLKINELQDEKVANLSGGQKQRVAIAREFVKNPQVIIADEPTSALDEKTSKDMMKILREISKTRTVIVVTHDTSLIEDKDQVYELDKGELISKPKEIIKKDIIKDQRSNYQLSFKNAFELALVNCKRGISRTVINIMALLVASTLLLVSLSGAVSSRGDSAFKELFDTYGEGILDISVVKSFMSASGTGEEKDEPAANVNQDIGGLYDKYLEDERVSHILFSQAFDEIKVTIDNKEVDIEKSGNVPVLNKLISGNMPVGNKNEVVIPRSLAEKMGLKEEAIIGKDLEFNCKIFNWDSGEPILMPVSIKATIVSVADTNMVYDYNGKAMEVSIDDSFFFSKAALMDIRKQGKIEGDKINFVIRAKSPKDMISIKDELNAQGIVPIGQFELVEDIVRLNNQTTEQSGSATMVIGILASVVAIAITFITSMMRRREYAIYKVSGFNNKHIGLEIFAEYTIVSICTIAIFLITSPGLNFITKAIFKSEILSGKLLALGALLVMVISILCLVVATFMAVNTKVSSALKTGEK